MSLKERLKTLLLKYPFIHIDQVGELSIIVPLTGARRVTESFTNSTAEPISLFLFGDNTCKADIERRRFFWGTEKNNFDDAFVNQFSQLIQELTVFQADVECNSRDKQFLQALMDKFEQLKEKAMAFKKNNPGHELMRNDLLHGDEIFLVKGEFLVNTYFDSIRALDLPNIATLNHGRVRSLKKLIPIELRRECLEALDHIQKVGLSAQFALVEELINAMTIEELRSYLNSKEPDKAPALLFELIYEGIRGRNDSLAKLDSQIFDVMQSNWDYLKYNDDWNKEDIASNVRLLFKHTNIVPEELPISFESIYQVCMNQVRGQHPDNDDSSFFRESTYQLFILQTFLCLCAIQLRLKNKEHAKRFLKIFDDKALLENLITTLCCNEQAFKKILQDEFQLSSQEYNLIANVTYSLCVDHLDADHFDELRLGCVADVAQQAHYIIMGGRLYWSTAPITETSAINSPRQQQQACLSRLDAFYNRRENFVTNAQAFSSIAKLFDAPLDNSSKQIILSNLPYLTTAQKNDLLLTAFRHRDYDKVRFIIEHIGKELYPTAFLNIMNKRSIDSTLMSLFLKQNANYARYIEGNDLLLAAQLGDLELLKLILHYRPDLLDYSDNLKQTALLAACRMGKAAIVEHLIAAGANIHARTMVAMDYGHKDGALSWPALTGAEWAKHSNHKDAAKIVALFDNYYVLMEQQLKSDPEYKKKFNAAHLTTAINNGDLKLIALYIKYCPDLQCLYNEEEKARALKQQTQRELLECIMPCYEKYRAVLNVLQKKAVGLSESAHEDERRAVDCIELLNKELAKAANKFFFQEFSTESLQTFQDECSRAIQGATPTLAEHRGWFEYSLVFRAILGVIATLTVIPALVVLVVSPSRYTDTFFATKDTIHTDSIKKVQQFEEGLTAIHMDLSNRFSGG